MMWPEAVEIKDEIGRYQMFKDGEPCCAWGHFNHEVTENHGEETPFIQAYLLCADTLGAFNVKMDSIRLSNLMNINDRSNLKTRVLLYNAAWAYLGYTEGQSKEVRDLAKKAKEKHDEVR